MPGCSLSAKQRTIIELIHDGFRDGEIAERLGTSRHSAKRDLHAIYDLLGLWNRLELALWYEARRDPVTGNVQWP